MVVSQAMGVLRRRWLPLLALVLVGLLGGLAYGALSPVRYQSTSTVFFSLDRGATVSEFTAGNAYVQDLVPSYAQVVTMPVVLDPVIAGLRLTATAQQLARQITATAQPNTVLMDITVTDAVPAAAAGVANAVAAELATEISKLSPRGGANAPQIRVTTTSPAVAATNPSSVRPGLVAGVGFAVGALLGIVLVAVLEVVARPVRTANDVAALTPEPVVGTIVRDRRAKKRPLPSRSHPHVARAERIAILRANLQFLHRGEEALVVVVASPQRGDGRTTTAANLAVSMATVARRVVLVDADLRNPGIAALLGVSNSTGLSTVLNGYADLDAVLQPWGESSAASATPRERLGLSVLPAGPVPPNPGELLASAAMEKVLGRLAAAFDVVVVDTAPLLPVADAGLVAGHVGSALLLLDSRRAQQQQVSEAVDRLRMSRVRVIGVALNNVAAGRGSRTYGRATGRAVSTPDARHTAHA
jgi:polysaccharide biosynthesis transport protein